MAIASVTAMGLGAPQIAAVVDAGGATMNAADEGQGVIGRVRLSSGPGTSKTISSSGGRVIIFLGSVTFADASTLVRVGFQDVGADGLNDGTFDVYKELVGGTDTLTASVPNSIAMATGSKTIADGDLVAIMATMTARGGADALSINRVSRGNAQAGLPYGMADLGTNVRSTSMLSAYFVTDDGTTGWIDDAYSNAISQVITGVTYNSGSSPDEYAAVFEVPVPVRADRVLLWLGAIASGDTLEYVLYTDPLGSPSVVDTIAIDEDQIGSTTGSNMWYVGELTSPVTFMPGTVYAIAARATSANDIQLRYTDWASGNEAIKAACPFFGSTVRLAARTDQTGAFSVTQVYHEPIFGLYATGFEDGASSGGGAVFGAQGGVVV